MNNSAAQVVEAMDEVASNVEGEMAMQAEAQAQERVAEILKELDPDGMLQGLQLSSIYSIIGGVKTLVVNEVEARRPCQHLF